MRAGDGAQVQTSKMYGQNENISENSSQYVKQYLYAIAYETLMGQHSYEVEMKQGDCERAKQKEITHKIAQEVQVKLGKGKKAAKKMNV